MKDEHQLGMLHYFNPENLRGNIEVAEEAANELQDEIQGLLGQLKTATDDMEKRILRGQIDKLKLERNIRRKRARMLRKDMAMYRQGFENRLEGMDGAFQSQNDTEQHNTQATPRAQALETLYLVVLKQIFSKTPVFKTERPKMKTMF